MVASNLVAFALLAMSSTSWAGPLNKRIAQTISASTTDWVQACQTAGGSEEQCNPLSQTAFMTLLAAAGPCDQQNAADQMIDLAKTLNNDANMIKFTQIFVQQPRNSPDSFSIPYCQQAPKNSELNGLFQCQFQGTKDTFIGNLQPGAPGTVPFGLTSLATPKSCPANPQGGVADGTQLTDITQDPGLNNVSSGSGSGSTKSGGGSTNSSSVSSSVVASSVTATATSVASSSVTEASSCDSPSSAVSSGTAAGNVAAASSTSSSFLLQNGQDAQKLNAEFKSLTADSACSTGDSACIGSKFALCNNGVFQLMDCGASVTCAALPLVNKAGTSVTCVTEDEAIQRIEATGATGGLTGSG